jgi:hypothetical protein
MDDEEWDGDRPSEPHARRRLGQTALSPLAFATIRAILYSVDINLV